MRRLGVGCGCSRALITRAHKLIKVAGAFAAVAGGGAYNPRAIRIFWMSLVPS